MNGWQGEGGEAAGGAIEALRNLDVTSSRISSNHATAGEGQSIWWWWKQRDRSGAFGGAISAGGNTAITNSMLADNAATGRTN